MNTELKYLLERMKNENVNTVEAVIAFMDKYVSEEVVWSLLSDEWNRMTLKSKVEFANRVINH